MINIICNKAKCTNVVDKYTNKRICRWDLYTASFCVQFLQTKMSSCPCYVPNVFATKRFCGKIKNFDAPWYLKSLFIMPSICTYINRKRNEWEYISIIYSHHINVNYNPVKWPLLTLEHSQNVKEWIDCTCPFFRNIQLLEKSHFQPRLLDDILKAYKYILGLFRLLPIKHLQFLN